MLIDACTQAQAPTQAHSTVFLIKGRSLSGLSGFNLIQSKSEFPFENRFVV